MIFGWSASKSLQLFAQRSTAAASTADWISEQAMVLLASVASVAQARSQPTFGVKPTKHLNFLGDDKGNESSFSQ